MAGLSGEVRLQGKLFNIINYDVITFACEAYIHKLMRETGLDIPLPFNEAETNIEYQVRLQARIVDSLKLPELLGGFLLPAGTNEADWDEAMAAGTAAHIRQLSNKADRQEVFRLGFEVNIYFFQQGLISLQHSQNSMDLMTREVSQPSVQNEGSPPTAAH